MAAVRFLKMLIMMHCIFKRGRQNQHFQSTLLGGRGSQKSTLCTLLIMLTIMDDSLVKSYNYTTNLPLLTSLTMKRKSRMGGPETTCHLRLYWLLCAPVFLVSISMPCGNAGRTKTHVRNY